MSDKKLVEAVAYGRYMEARQASLSKDTVPCSRCGRSLNPRTCTESGMDLRTGVLEFFCDFDDVECERPEAHA
jgi:hypothetical protein